jgi:hypothetical protein
MAKREGFDEWKEDWMLGYYVERERALKETVREQSFCLISLLIVHF